MVLLSRDSSVLNAMADRGVNVPSQLVVETQDSSGGNATGLPATSGVWMDIEVMHERVIAVSLQRKVHGTWVTEVLPIPPSHQHWMHTYLKDFILHPEPSIKRDGPQHQVTLVTGGMDRLITDAVSSCLSSPPKDGSVALTFAPIGGMSPKQLSSVLLTPMK